MEYRQLGSAGVRVSVIGLGTNRFGVAPLQQTEVNRVIDRRWTWGSTLLTRPIPIRRGVQKKH